MRRCRREYLGFPAEDLELDILTGKVSEGKLQSFVEIPHDPVTALPQTLAKVIVTVANQLRAKQEDLLKPPATQELMMAGHDVIRLSRWGSLGLAGAITFGWLAAFQEDREILKGIITPEKLNGLLEQAVKASAADISRQELGKVGDDFVKFGS